MSAQLKTVASTKKPTFLRVAEVAELLRVTPDTIYALVARRAIPFRKPSGILLFELDEINEWTKHSDKK